jgi:hypothetical protein
MAILLEPLPQTELVLSGTQESRLLFGMFTTLVEMLAIVVLPNCSLFLPSLKMTTYFLFERDDCSSKKCTFVDACGGLMD